MAASWVAWIGVWQVNPLIWIVAGLALVGYRWFPGARRDRRAVAWISGLAVTLVALESGLDLAGAQFLFTAHMVQHLLLAMVAPPLLIRGLPDATVDALLGRWPGRILDVLVQPVLAASAYFVVLVFWHLPGPLDFSLGQPPIYFLQHLSFLAVGLIFWWAVVIHREGRPWNLSPLGEVAYLTCGALPSVVVGLTLALLPRAIYSFYALHAPRWGINALTDQHAGGLLMFGFDNILMVGFAAYYFWKLFPDDADRDAIEQVLASRTRPVAPDPLLGTKKETRQ